MKVIKNVNELGEIELIIMEGDNDPYINHILLSSFNISNHIGEPETLFDYCTE